jgi:hypothetical protein
VTAKTAVQPATCMSQIDLVPNQLGCLANADFKELARAIMRSQKALEHPGVVGKCDGRNLGVFVVQVNGDMSALLPGCYGTCISTSRCSFLHKLNDTAVKKLHCQACLMPLKRVQGQNMHPSAPGWRMCEFNNRDHIRRYLVLASRGIDIKVALPAGFPKTGPDDALNWAFTANPASPPNIVLFLAALYGLI